MNDVHPVISTFQKAAADVPAYQQILQKTGVDPAGINSLEDFCAKVPVLDKQSTFGSFPVVQLCRGGHLGRPAGVLTSSGHSGQFAFGIYGMADAQGEVEQIDNALDLLFQVRSKPTLLINCLPMGVQVPTRACTLAQVSVREDMATVLVKELAQHYEQIILVGETAFIKQVLELGLRQGIDWQKILVHVIVGEEPLAENARKYLGSILGSDMHQPQSGIIGSSMGVAEVGLNLFFEFPELIILRRMLHETPQIRHALFPDAPASVPMLFTYNPERIFLEIIGNNELVVTTLDPQRPLPLIRYRTGDVAQLINLEALAQVIPPLKEKISALGEFPLIAVAGRGEAILAGETPVFPEEVKEGIYHDPDLAAKTTGNFRLSSGPDRGVLRIQLSPGVAEEPELALRFTQAISHYVTAPLAVQCQAYESFRDGMILDYERKFAYIEKS
jgi:phenylacetate-coenzyme A ligase PaaK-like adenylate-forming protein